MENDMGVYIPNMSKPKSCKECQWHLDFYIEDEQVGGLCTITEKDDKENDCPLIEIARCGECEYADEYNHCKYSAWWNGNADFCSHGIRRKENR